MRAAFARIAADYRFRVWDPEEEEFEFISLTDLSSLVDWDASQKAIDAGNGCIDVVFRDLGPLSVEQRTGVRDLRGASIWEGDIVQEVYVEPIEPDSLIGGPTQERRGDIGVVRYVPEGVVLTKGAFMVVIEGLSHGDAAYAHLGLARWTDGTHRYWERLGNIHEHSHLLLTSPTQPQ